MSSEAELVLLDCWVSPFCMRVQIATAEKGLQHESRQEDLLGAKRELLLASNHNYKKVSVLLHNGKPLCESTFIVQGSLESTKSDSTRVGAIWRGKADELDAAKMNFLDVVRQLEGALGEKDYFGGDVFGYMHVIAIAMTSWFPAYERFGWFKVEDHCPKLTAWMKRCTVRESVAKVIPDATQVCEFVAMLRKMMGIE